ncbi:MAG: LysR family transcriptional regulator [Rhodobacteraceae bacterium]|nr:LysR family transcriptional regulator [Paracoccaceae bacterium]
MQTLSHLKALQALDAAIRLGTLTSAASELGVTPAALGQRIRTLEVYLGVPLLERGPRGTVPTPAALEAAEDLSEGFRKLESAAKKLQFERLNEIYIHADPDWAELWLMPRLEAFKTLYPSISVIVDDFTESTSRKPDFKIRLTKTNAINGATLYPEYLVPVSSPQIRDWITHLPRETRLEGFSLLHLTSQTNPPHMFGWPEWVELFGYRGAVTGRAIQYARASQALRAAVHTNAGLVICGLSLVFEQLDSGALTTPFAIGEGAWSGYSYELVFHQDVLLRPQAVKFHDWLKEAAEETNARLTSVCPRAPS